MDTTSLLIGAASRPYPGETANGDAWGVHWQDDGCRLALIDGLGHGPEAAAAARAALDLLAARPALPPDEAIRACHRALGGTRGAAISIASVAPRGPDAAEVTFAGIGNVEARLWQGGRGRYLIAQRGIVGATMPTPRPTTIRVARDWLLVMHSDGVSARFTLDDAPAGDARAPRALAEAILARWGRATDDATVVVASPAAAGSRPR